jgi:hypothetical protein
MSFRVLSTCISGMISLAAMLSAGGCGDSQSLGTNALPIILRIEPGPNSFEVDCPNGLLLARVYENGFAEGSAVRPISVWGFLRSGRNSAIFTADENPLAPEGMSFVYYSWIQVDNQHLSVTLDVHEGQNPVLVISKPKP